MDSSSSSALRRFREGAGGVSRALVALAYWAAGVDRLMLDRGLSWSERARLASRGGLMLLIAAVNGVCAWGALSLIFQPHLSGAWINYPLMAVIALVWLLMVLNLNRFVMSSVGAGDGRPSVSAREWVGAIVQVTGAGLIALSVAVPATIMILQDEIRGQMTAGQLSAVLAAESAIEGRYESALHNLYEEKVVLFRRNEEAQERKARLLALLLVTRNPEAVRVDIARAEQEEEALSVKLKDLESKVQEVRREMAQAKKAAAAAAEQVEGLWSDTARVFASAPWILAWVMTILLLLQAAPVLVRPFVATGPYEQAVALQNEVVFAKYGIAREGESATDKRGVGFRFDTFLVPRRLEREMVASLRERGVKAAEQRQARAAEAVRRIRARY